MCIPRRDFISHEGVIKFGIFIRRVIIYLLVEILGIYNLSCIPSKMIRVVEIEEITS